VPHGISDSIASLGRRRDRDLVSLDDCLHGLDCCLICFTSPEPKLAAICTVGVAGAHSTLVAAVLSGPTTLSPG